MREREILEEKLTEIIANMPNSVDCIVAEAEYIADHLLANGVIVPPCKMGTTVYRVVEMGTGVHYKQVGRHGYGFKFVPCEEKIKRFIRTVEVTKNNFFDICVNFGKTIFLTKEEAERALKGGEE